MNKIESNILSLVEEDYISIWEILSVVTRKIQNEDENTIINIVFNSLTYLLNNGCLKLYKGVYFNNDEIEVENFVLTKDFIFLHKDDWKI